MEIEFFDGRVGAHTDGRRRLSSRVAKLKNRVRIATAARDRAIFLKWEDGRCRARSRSRNITRLARRRRNRAFSRASLLVGDPGQVDRYARRAICRNGHVRHRIRGCLAQLQWHSGGSRGRHGNRVAREANDALAEAVANGLIASRRWRRCRCRIRKRQAPSSSAACAT